MQPQTVSPAPTVPPSSRAPSPADAAPSRDALRTAERALRLTLGVLAPRLRSGARWADHNLGISRPSYERACVRNHAFMAQIARELGDWYERFVREAEVNAVGTGFWRRVERDHLDDAATELMDVVRRMSPPVRDVVVRRAVGQSWRDISRALPERAYFSLTDDWQLALRTLARDHGPLLRRLV